MNRVPATIESITKTNEFHLLTLSANNRNIRVLTLNLIDEFYTGADVMLMFKETEVSITCVDDNTISIANVIPATITALREGELFAEVTLASNIGAFRACVLQSYINDVSLKTGMPVFALIKANEITIARG